MGKESTCHVGDQEMWVPSLGWEDPLEEGMAIHPSTLDWRIPWTEEPGGLQSTGSQRAGHDPVHTQAHSSVYLASASVSMFPLPPQSKCGERYDDAHFQTNFIAGSGQGRRESHDSFISLLPFIHSKYSLSTNYKPGIVTPFLSSRL